MATLDERANKHVERMKAMVALADENAPIYRRRRILAAELERERYRDEATRYAVLGLYCIVVLCVVGVAVLAVIHHG